MVKWLRIHQQMLGHRFNPWSGKIPLAVRQLGLYATTPEPVLCPMRSLCAPPRE